VLPPALTAAAGAEPPAAPAPRLGPSRARRANPLESTDTPSASTPSSNATALRVLVT
jgi:hypothetical protein